MGLSGKRPQGLGITDGRFAPVGWKPNHVSTQAEPSDKQHYIKVIEFEPGEDPLDVWERLVAAVKALPRAKVVKEKRDYVHLEVSSLILGFVDDLEIYLPPPMLCIHVRSAARLGIRDFDVNRKRVEALREAVKRKPA
jgi:uncharacterized protein (DUF1499 family)